MDEKKNTRGGKREGAGRPKTMAKAINFCASKEVADILSEVSKKSEFINKAIIEYAKKLNLTPTIRQEGGFNNRN